MRDFGGLNTQYQRNYLYAPITMQFYRAHAI